VFVPFAAGFAGSSVSMDQYPSLMLTGLLRLFSSRLAAQFDPRQVSYDLSISFKLANGVILESRSQAVRRGEVVNDR